MRRIVTLTICVGIAAAFCTWFVMQKNNMSRTLKKLVQRGSGITVDFTAVAPFDWERFYVFGPYTTHQKIHHSLGFYWPGVVDTTIEYSDSVNLVVFVQGGKVVDWFEHPRSQVELIELTRLQGYSREEACFQVSLAGSDQCPRLVKSDK